MEECMKARVKKVRLKVMHLQPGVRLTTLEVSQKTDTPSVLRNLDLKRSIQKKYMKLRLQAMNLPDRFLNLPEKFLGLHWQML
jgi:hypothetical protein